MKRTKPALSRRGFIGGVTAAGLGLAARAHAHAGALRADVEVAVIGAGLSGLVAARELADCGRYVLVLEARDRVGGRTWSRPAGPVVVDGGAQWVGGTQTQVRALARELGVALIPRYTAGDTVVRTGATTQRLPRDLPPEPEVVAVQARLEQLARTVPLDAPWTAPAARALDARTVATWLLEQRAAPAAVEAIGATIGAALSATPAQVSLLWFLFYLRSAGGFRALDVDAQAFQLAGGTQALALRLAQQLAGEIVLGARVYTVARLGNGRVRIDTHAGTVVADRAVVAMMPADAARLAFQPALPAARRTLGAEWTVSSGTKAHLVYATPFWRAQGLSGLAVSDTGAVALTFDATPGAAPQGAGVLVAFVNDAASGASPQARRGAILGAVRALFGPAAASPLAFVETRWAQEAFTAGCVSPLAPGVLTRGGAALRAPVGPIHFAGTETSPVWCGYLEGAVRAGRRAAAEVDAALA